LHKDILERGGFFAETYLNVYGLTSDIIRLLGHLYVKSDIYGFGVVLLEMLSGRQAFDANRLAGIST